jgi:hypothetical protein
MKSQPATAGNKVCVISQPTFLPWLGWFDLVDQADVMVILDDVAFSKQSWQQRNRIRTACGLEFLSVPVRSAGRLGQRIDECELDSSKFVRKMIGSLQANYGRAPWSGFIGDLADVMSRAADSGKLVELNCALIDWIAARLEVKTPMLRAGSLAAGGHRGEHVASICETLGATDYLSPAGAEAYLLDDRSAFDSRGIAVWLHVYEHPQYTQRHAPFLPYASSLDLILNEGPNAPAVMRSGRRPARPLGTGIPCMEQTS